MNEELIAEALIGDEAERFVETELGKTILGMAKQEVMAAQEELEKVDPDNVKKIRDLQNQAWRARSFESWLVELITKGRQALEVHKHESQE